MKVVFSCVPQTGHITPLLPLAEAFTANGDEVIIASGPDAEDVASSRGLPFRSVGSPFDSWFAALSAGRGGFPVTDSPRHAWRATSSRGCSARSAWHL